jgi:hypothetical protein
MLKEGHWRCDDEEAEKNAWEESVRLREQMFWSRMGGGVIPVGAAHNNIQEVTPRASEEVEMLKELESTGDIVPRDVTPIPEASQVDGDNVEDAPVAANKRVSKSLERDTAEGLWKASQEDALAPVPTESTVTTTVPEAEDTPAEESAEPKVQEGDKSNRVSTQSLGVAGSEKEGKRISITIPRTESQEKVEKRLSTSNSKPE